MSSNGNYWSRLQARQLSRRRMLAASGVTAAGAASFALVGCGDDDDKGSATTAPGGTTSSGGTTAAGAFPYPTKDFDKIAATDMREVFHGKKLKLLPDQAKGPKAGGKINHNWIPEYSWDILGPNAGYLAAAKWSHNQLFELKSSDFNDNPNILEVEPVLVKSYEQADDTTVVFHLQQGVKFQDVAPVNGREMTADDIVYCSQAFKDPKAAAQSPNYEDVTSITALDKYTVQFKFAKPAAYFLASLGMPHHWIFSKEQHQSADGLVKKPIGTGPFLFDHYEDQVQGAFKKNPAYWRKDKNGKQLPYIDNFEFNYTANPAAGLAAFRSKQQDYIVANDFKAWQDLVKSDPDVITQVNTPAASFQPFFGMRLDKAPFNDKRVRQALSMLINRDSLIKDLFYGMASYGYGADFNYMGKEYPFEPSELGKYMKYDVAEAKKLLDAAGVKSLQFDLISQFGPGSGSYFDLVAAVAASWEKDAGIKVNINAPSDIAVWAKEYYTGTFKDLVSTGFIGPGVDPSTYTYDALYSKSPKNYYKVNDPKMDEMVLKQRSMLNKDERKKLITEIMAYDNEQVTRLWTVNQYHIHVRRPNVFNVLDLSNAWAGGWNAADLENAWKL